MYEVGDRIYTNDNGIREWEIVEVRRFSTRMFTIGNPSSIKVEGKINYLLCYPIINNARGPITQVLSDKYIFNSKAQAIEHRLKELEEGKEKADRKLEEFKEECNAEDLNPSLSYIEEIMYKRNPDKIPIVKSIRSRLNCDLKTAVDIIREYDRHKEGIKEI